MERCDRKDKVKGLVAALWQWQSITDSSRSRGGTNSLVKWISFSSEDNALIEQAYQSLQCESTEILLTDNKTVVDIYHAVMYEDGTKVRRV